MTLTEMPFDAQGEMVEKHLGSEVIAGDVSESGALARK